MKNNDEIRNEVREKYAAIARSQTSCCEPSSACCDSDIPVAMIGDEYQTLDGYQQAADLKLGCGLPTESAGLEPGQTVVDLGSGAGNDCFVARAIVGDTGKVIGVDFAEDMIALARENARQLGAENVEFVLGEIEEIPLPDQVADVVVSNCVMNLVPDKSRAFRQTWRILKPGGHFSISDIVYVGTMPGALREVADLYTGCVAGAVQRDTYLETIRQAGFVNISIPIEKTIQIPDEVLAKHLTPAQQTEFAGFQVQSITVNATRPRN